MRRGRDGDELFTDDTDDTATPVATTDDPPAPRMTRDEARAHIRALLAARRDERGGAT